jgi:hypothetical protein
VITEIILVLFLVLLLIIIGLITFLNICLLGDLHPTPIVSVFRLGLGKHIHPTP